MIQRSLKLDSKLSVSLSPDAFHKDAQLAYIGNLVFFAFIPKGIYEFRGCSILSNLFFDSKFEFVVGNRVVVYSSYFERLR